MKRPVAVARQYRPGTRSALSLVAALRCRRQAMRGWPRVPETSTKADAGQGAGGGIDLEFVACASMFAFMPERNSIPIPNESHDSVAFDYRSPGSDAR
jgi:hypothetical protein